MITEHAVLDVVAGREDEFVAAMERAKGLIAASPGFVSLRVERCVEQPSRFLLLVEWERLEDHTEGFRGSAAYERVARRAAPLLRPVPRGRALRGDHHGLSPLAPPKVSPALFSLGLVPSRNFIHVALCSWFVHV